MAAPIAASITNASAVTLVTQTRVRDDCAADFARWQERVNAVIAGFAGFVEHEVMPPALPVQPDWVIVQRFTSLDAAQAWLGSDDRQRLIDVAQPWLVGEDDIHVIAADDVEHAPAPVTAVISEHIAPGQEEAYRAWQRRIAAAQSRFLGFQGYRLEPPRPGIQDNWVTILRFDSAEHLDAWLHSPERQRLMAEAAPFTADTRTRTVRTGFDGWFRLGDEAASSPAAWKQNMLVILALYPVVFLFGRWVQTPLLMNRAGMPFWLALFAGNVASVLLLSQIVPWISNVFAWWLRPLRPDGERMRWAGAAVIVALYGVCLAIFSRFPG